MVLKMNLDKNVEEQLENLLEKYLDCIGVNIADFKTIKRGESFKRKELFVRTIVTDFEYDKGINKHSSRIDYYTEERTTFYNPKNYLKRMSSKFPLITEIVSFLKDQFKIEESEAIKKFFQFSELIVFNPQNRLLEKTPDQLISQFINDLKGINPDCDIKLWIKGIWLSDETLQISHNQIISKPVSEDLNRVKPFTFYFAGWGMRGSDSADTIIQIKIPNINEDELRIYLDKYITALALFKLGSVSKVRNNIETNSISNTYTIYEQGKETSTKFKYQLTEKDTAVLKDFLTKVIEFLPPPNWQNNYTIKNSAVFIAIDRYQEALYDSKVLESKITNLITSLEALFLNNSETMELSHKLSQRAAFVLSLFNHDPINAYKTLKKSYSIRSLYIHGSRSRKSKPADIYEPLFNFTRKCIVFFIFLSPSLNKEGLVNLIDQGLLSTKKKSEIENIFKTEFSDSLVSAIE